MPNIKRGKKKSGQAAIVAVIILILIVIVTAVTIISFVIPFVKEKISSGDCFDVIGSDKVSIASGYTCYDIDNSIMRVQIHLGAVRNLIGGFSIEVGGASTNNYKIIDDGTLADVTMYGGATTLELPPNDNSGRTYLIANIAPKPNLIKVYPILKDGRVCDASDVQITIDNCL